MSQKLRAAIDRFVQWVCQEKHKEKAQQLRKDVEKAFTEHPHSTGETYLQHLAFTAKMSSHLVFVGFTLLAHGLFPFAFTRTASKEIENVYFTMRMRLPKSVKSRKRPIANILQFKKPVTAPNILRVGVVGGGFSGTMVVANLVRNASFPFSIEWYDESENLTSGVAYGTGNNAHLLNVRAGKMGAFPDKPSDFYDWLQSAEGRASAVTLCPGKEISAESFLPRLLYGAYLKSINEQTLQIARDKGIDIRIIRAQVIDARIYNQETKQLIVSSLKGTIEKESLVDALVLAIGNLPPRDFSFQRGMVSGNGQYIEDIWHTKENSIFPQDVSQLSADSEVVIIGAGLTMTDAVLTLKNQGFKGTITTISRHGWLPAAHTDNLKPYPAWSWTINPETAPDTALGMLCVLREEAEKATAHGYDWRSVVDSIRPVTQSLWQRLSINEKRQFITHLLSVWNIHRHRMAPEIHADLKAMIKSGTLRTVAGRIYYIGSDEMGITVAYRKRGINRVETIRAALVLNCTGPQYDIAASKHTLIRNLRDRELVSVGPLRFGIEVNEEGSAEGNAQGVIFPIGSLLVGELIESTAIPELRGQASNIAVAVAEKMAQLQSPEGDNRMFGTWI